ncbi:hypothetical protein BW707_14620 [Escherichia coli]|nr:hypothetical protein BW707_14620 [Escherichia coli]TFA17895.1 hypothetical protein BON86_07980 [Escherichia coli]
MPPSPPYLKKSSYESTGFFSHFICLYGSELKYYTFSPLLIKQNHLIFLLPPFFILTFPQH